MGPLTVNEMQALQLELHEAYRDEWDPLCPEEAGSCLLWMMSEAGEVIDVIKKKGVHAVVEDPEIHAHFTEEVCDLLMHLTDALLCLQVTPGEISESFRAKQRRNLHRWKDEEDSQ